MSTILNIETSTDYCSVAISQGEAITFSIGAPSTTSHAAIIGLYIEEALKQCRNIDAVAVSSGPGSYTGLRIGASISKGLCFGLGVPLIAIRTLELMAHAAIKKQLSPDALYCPMIDARRMEVFSELFDSSLNHVRETQADIVTAETYLEYLDKKTVLFFGNGMPKCKTVLNHPNAHFIEDIHPWASEMASLSAAAFEKKQFENTAYFEPYYFKEYHAVISRNKVLGR